LFVFFFLQVYYHNNIYKDGDSRVWQGLYWRDIMEDEMYRFLGILLAISLHPIDYSGYPAYFRDSDLVIQLSTNSSKRLTIPQSKGFAALVDPSVRMSVNRFKQIRGAFHPESKKKANSDNQDKCYQLRLAINELSAASLQNFVPERNCSFDQGGCSCQLRYCPVRQYNKDKPQKFRVDFFILAGSKSYIIYHINVYQGKNSSNVGIDPKCFNLPTTMKAVSMRLFFLPHGSPCEHVIAFLATISVDQWSLLSG
jgi:Transposase IS4